MRVETIKDGVHVHTKVSKTVKRQVEQLRKKTGRNENVLFNTAISRGLKTMTVTK